jgi:hypothetical protein
MDEHMKIYYGWNAQDITTRVGNNNELAHVIKKLGAIVQFTSLNVNYNFAKKNYI